MEFSSVRFHHLNLHKKFQSAPCYGSQHWTWFRNVKSRTHMCINTDCIYSSYFFYYNIAFNWQKRSSLKFTIKTLKLLQHKIFESMASLTQPWKCVCHCSTINTSIWVHFEQDVSFRPSLNPPEIGPFKNLIQQWEDPISPSKIIVFDFTLYSWSMNQIFLLLQNKKSILLLLRFCHKEEVDTEYFCNTYLKCITHALSHHVFPGKSKMGNSFGYFS